MTRTILPVLMGLLALTACARDHEHSNALGSASPTLESIVAQNTEALGGKAALDAVDNMVKHSRIVEDGESVTAVFATDREGRMRVDILAARQRVFAESFDGQNGHQWRPDEGQTPASVQGTVALRHTSQLPNHIFRLKDLETNGHRLRRVDGETIDGRMYSILQLTLSDGFETFLWFDHDSGYVTRVRNERALHVDVDSNERFIETRISDFRSAGSLVHPHRVEEVDMATGEVLVEIELERLATNALLPADYFSDLKLAPISPLP